MIRTVTGGLVDKFLSASLLEMLSHQFDTDVISPCDDVKCEISEEEWQAVPEEFAIEAIDNAIDAFADVGDLVFVRKKIAHIVKLAKSETGFQLDLVSELVLSQMGVNSYKFDWIDDTGGFHDIDEVIDFPERDALIESVKVDELDDDDRQYNRHMASYFRSFFTLMSVGDDFVFWDLDFLFLLEDEIPEGMYKLYLTVPDYDREWYERPWRDIGEPTPEAVTVALDAVERKAKRFGNINKMRATLAMRALSEMTATENILPEPDPGTLDENAVSQIIGDAEAIRVIIDDTVEDLSLKEQHRQQAIYVLAEHIISRAMNE